MGDPSDYNSEIGGVYADFGSLAQQGFLTAFTSREHSSQVKAAGSKKRRSHFFDTLKHPLRVASFYSAIGTSSKKFANSS